MALICPACGTENRSVAKFCIECIARLPVDFAPTQVIAPLAAPEDVGPPSLPPALAAFASAASSPPLPLGWGEHPSIPIPIPVAPAPPKRRAGWWALALMASAALLAAGWGLGRLSDEGGAALPSPSEAGRAASGVVQPERPAQAAALAPAQPSPPQAAEAPLGGQDVLAPAATLAPVEHAAPAGAVPEPAKPRSPARKPEAAAAAHATRGALFAACDGLNFVRASQCRVSICTQDAYRARADCAPVLAQLRRMDQMRNPSLGN